MTENTKLGRRAFLGAGAAQELAKGSFAAGVVSLDTTCFGEGNGLSRHIDLRAWR